MKRDCGYVPIFGIGGLKDGTTQCNIVVPPRLRYLPPLDNGILDTEKLEKVQSKHKLKQLINEAEAENSDSSGKVNSKDENNGEEQTKEDVASFKYTFEVYESKYGKSRFYNNGASEEKQ